MPVRRHERRMIVAGLASALLVMGCASGGRRPDQSAVAAAPATGPSTATTPAWEPVGLSLGGRRIEAVTLGAAGPRVLIVGGIHGDEAEGGRVIDRVVDHLASKRPGVSVRIVRDVNPDGTAAGTRTNSRGVDLNRNWPARNFAPAPERGGAPLSEPETRALHREIERFRPELVLVCHSSARGPFVNFDGPASAHAAEFASGAATTDPRWRVVPQMGYPTPGSLGSYVGVDGGVPILTIEFARGEGSDLAWGAMRAGLDSCLGIYEGPLVGGPLAGAPARAVDEPAR